jgi:hypothetical protein
VQALLTEDEVSRCFDVNHHLANLAHTWEQLGI